MLEVLGVRAPFVGMGVDALLLEDQEAVGRIVDRVPVARRLLGGASALRAVGRAALDAAVRRRRSAARARHQRRRARDRDARAPARPAARSRRGRCCGRATCTLVAGATIPFFGFGLKMFAFAGTRDGRFHLRCGDSSLFEILRSTPAAFRGEYFSEHVADFLCDRVAIELDRETAVEAGGELLGRHRHVELALASPITLVSLRD